MLHTCSAHECAERAYSEGGFCAGHMRDISDFSDWLDNDRRMVVRSYGLEEDRAEAVFSSANPACSFDTARARWSTDQRELRR